MISDFTTLGFVFYFLLLIFLLYFEPLVIIVFFKPLLTDFSSYISVYYIDSGDVFMRELDLYSTKSITSLYALTFYTVSIFIFLLILKNYKKNLQFLFQTKHIKYIRPWIIISLSIISLLIFNVLISGSPLWVSTINKTTFWTFAKLGFLKPISSQISIIALFSGMFLIYTYLFNKPKLKLGLFTILVLLLLYLILMGHKFGQLLTMLYLFFLPILIFKILNKNFSPSRFIFVALFMIIFLFIPIYNYFESKYGEYALNMIGERIFSMNGQLIYASIQDYIEGNLHLNLHQIILEFKSIFNFQGNEPVNMHYLMDLYMPSKLLFSYLANGVNLSKGYLPMLFHLFGGFSLALTIHLLIIILISIIGYLFIKSVIEFNFISSALYSKVFLNISSFYGQGTLDAFLNIKTFFYIYLIALIYIIRNIQKYQKKKVLYEHITYS